MYSATLTIFIVATAHAGVVYPVLIESRSGNSRGAVQISKDYVIDLEESSVLGDSLYFSDAKYGEVNHELEGYLNFTHGIEPLRIHDKSGRIPHRIFPLPTPEEAIHLESYPAEPPTVWRPEMYVMLDSVIHKSLQESKYLQARYIIRLMNITKEDEYFVVEEDNVVEAYESLYLFGQFTKNTTFARPADFYLMLFGRRLGRRNEKTIKVSPGLQGLASPGLVCVKGWNVGISEGAPPLYHRFTTIAHEIGHLLGCTHDGSGPLEYIPNHPGAVDCKYKEKYIMKAVGHRGPPFAFSNCSEVQMQFVLKLHGEKCWKTQSDYDFFNVTKEVAGRRLTPEMLCRSINPEQYFSASMKNCVITCRNLVSGLYGTEETYFAPFGYPCGNNGERCWFGNCTNIDHVVS